MYYKTNVSSLNVTFGVSRATTTTANTDFMLGRFLSAANPCSTLLFPIYHCSNVAVVVVVWGLAQSALVLGSVPESSRFF